MCGIDERFETGEIDLLEAQGAVLPRKRGCAAGLNG
jgi:hypothetical protein